MCVWQRAKDIRSVVVGQWADTGWDPWKGKRETQAWARSVCVLISRRLPAASLARLQTSDSDKIQEESAHWVSNLAGWHQCIDCIEPIYQRFYICVYICTQSLVCFSWEQSLFQKNNFHAQFPTRSYRLIMFSMWNSHLLNFQTFDILIANFENLAVWR